MSKDNKQVVNIDDSKPTQSESVTPVFTKEQMQKIAEISDNVSMHNILSFTRDVLIVTVGIYAFTYLATSVAGSFIRSVIKDK